jgi:hypothetical protein
VPAGVWNISWLDQNSQRAYPLSEDSSRFDQTGSIQLPNSFIVELKWPTHVGLNVQPDQFFLRQVTVAPTGFSLSLAYNDGSSNPPIVATTSFAASTHKEFNIYTLAGVNNFADCVGQICIGTLDEILLLPPGDYQFNFSGGQLDADAIVPMTRSVTSITCVNGQQRSAPLYGAIELVAGQNMRITPTIAVGQNPQIRFDAINGEGLTDNCACGTDVLGPPIRTVNGIPPTLLGDFSVLDGPCIQITSLTNGLQVSDTCSQPCCGCAELQALIDQITQFATQANTLQVYVAQLASQVQQTQTVILSSNINNSACASS